MKLVDLDPEWINDAQPGGGHSRPAELTLETAQGVKFLCPACFRRNGGPTGTHSILAWFRDRGVPDDAVPGPGRWTVSGTGFADLTLSPSIDLTSGGARPDEWHGFVQNGEVTGA